MAPYSFKNDYSEGAHPRILNALHSDNLHQLQGYGEDPFTLQAEDILRQAIGTPEAAIHLVTGGTQANLVSMAAMLSRYESIIAASSSHIAMHETGAIESLGHKIHVINSTDGKLRPEDIDPIVLLHCDEHMVIPRVVFISQSTELGTLYSLREIEELSLYCRGHHLLLYVDGARLGSAITASSSDCTLKDLGRLTDAFYIGGTKNGALMGEALVLVNKEIQPRFRYILKQKGALMAKGRFLGIQFYELFRDGLYFDLAKQANIMAKKLSDGIAALNYRFLVPPASNQIFPILSLHVADSLSAKYDFYTWTELANQEIAIRLVTSWATNEKFIDQFLIDLRPISSTSY